MNISVRFEGGIGDHLAANRFIPAIKEKYPDSKIFAYSDTEGSSIQADVLWDNFRDLYEKIAVIPNKKHSEYIINLGFGEENYTSHLNNVPDSFYTEMHSFDKFYDLHIDGLKWSHYDFPWQKYFYQFPTPTNFNFDKEKSSEKIILCHLYSRSNSPYLLHNWYIKALTKDLSKNFDKILLIADPNNPQTTEYYQKNAYEAENIKIITPSLNEVFNLSYQCSAFLGIDSGLRYIPYHFGRPTFVFSDSCHQLGKVSYSHLIRWIIFKDQALPMHHPTNEVVNILRNSVQNGLFGLLSLPTTYEKAKKSIVERNLTSV